MIYNQHMKRLLIILAAVVALIAAIIASAKDDLEIDHLIKLGNASDAPELMASADSAIATGDTERALVDYMIICRRTYDSQDNESRRIGVRAHINAGDIYFSGGNYANALDFYLKGIELSEDTEGRPDIAELYKNIGNVYNVFKDHEKAMIEYEKGLQYADSVSDTLVQLKIYQNLTGTCVSLHDPVKGREYYEKALALPCHYDVGKFMNLYNHALLLHEEKRYGEAAGVFRNVVEMAKRLRLPPKYECSAYEGLYKSYGEMGRKDSTLYYLERCISFARESELIHMFSETYRHLADFYDNNGNPQVALRLRSEFLQLQDSIFDIRSFDALKNQQFIYEMNKTEQKINALHERERQHNEVIRWQRVAILLTVVAIAVIVILLINLYRKKRKLDTSYRNLWQLNNQLMQSHNIAVEQRQRLRKEEERAKEERNALREEERGEERDVRGECEVMGDDRAEEAGAPAKYASSPLDGERQALLLDKISAVMEEEKAYCNPNFSLDSLAESVGSNSRYVSQAINEVYGKNFSSYVNEYRVRLACERLADTENYGSMVIRAIGESVGFKSQSTFLAAFKKITGMTPSLYLKLAKEEKTRPDVSDS